MAVAIFFVLGAREWYFAAIGTLNLVMTAILVAGIAMQSTVLPSTYAGCNGLAASWRQALPIDMRDSPTASEASLHSACQRMVEHWAFAIAIVGLYMPYSLLMMFHGVRGIMYPRAPRRPRPKNTKSVMVQAAIYFAFRYIAKLFQRLNPRTGTPPKQVATRQDNAVNRRSNLATGLRRGEKFVGLSPRVLPSNVLLNIASYSHYVDILNLHAAYGSLFHAYIGNEGEESKLEELRVYTCSSEKAKQECRLCRAQICESCWASTLAPSTPMRRHLESCSPSCSSCFYKSYVLKITPSCDMDSISNAEPRYQYNHKNTCRNCAMMTDSERIRMVVLEDEAELYKFSKEPLSCASCKKNLPASGPRWWICPCGQECRQSIHLPWGPGDKS
ncbi:hypothetical protein BDV26DRAFT_264990 [Aspergillus bertholletiae]|uniref:Uncharacterized protein n=1 Tax=Aspergillus bertholletiae TaxID=1226010 RepID=A0A5N7B3V2_9EURO|nr:hypothetical protein BDV26DRAFT_264990 [Aspergillus bertholletiae]